MSKEIPTTHPGYSEVIDAVVNTKAYRKRTDRERQEELERQAIEREEELTTLYSTERVREVQKQDLQVLLDNGIGRLFAASAQAIKEAYPDVKVRKSIPTGDFDDKMFIDIMYDLKEQGPWVYYRGFKATFIYPQNYQIEEYVDPDIRDRLRVNATDEYLFFGKLAGANDQHPAAARFIAKRIRKDSDPTMRFFAPRSNWDRIKNVLRPEEVYKPSEIIYPFGTK